MLILERLLELHDKKQWMQDLATECILLLLRKISHMHFVPVLNRIKHLILIPLKEMNANKVLMALGLQHFIDSNDAFSTASASVFGSSSLFSLDNIHEISSALLSSASKFPKVRDLLHRQPRLHRQ